MRQKTITFEPSSGDVQFIVAQIQDGKYKTQSEVIRAGIRQLEKEDIQLKALRRLIDEGDKSGTPVPFILDNFLAEMRAKQNAG